MAAEEYIKIRKGVSSFWIGLLAQFTTMVVIATSAYFQIQANKENIQDNKNLLRQFAQAIELVKYHDREIQRLRDDLEENGRRHVR